MNDNTSNKITMPQRKYLYPLDEDDKVRITKSVHRLIDFGIDNTTAIIISGQEVNIFSANWNTVSIKHPVDFFYTDRRHGMNIIVLPRTNEYIT